MKKLLLVGLLGAVGFILLLVAALFALPYITNLERVRNEVATAASITLQRPVTMTRLSLQALPGPGLLIDDLTITERNGVPILNVDQLIIEVKLGPILQRNLVVDRIVIERPQVNLTRNPDGSLNLPVPPPTAGPSLLDTFAQYGLPPLTLALDKVELADGEITIRDKAGPNRSPLLHAQGLDVALDDVSLTTVLAKSGGASPASFLLSRLTAEGTMTLREVLYQQAIKVENIRGTLAVKDGVVRLNDVSLSLFGGKGNGQLAAHMHGVPPRYESNLTMESLHMDQVFTALQMAPALVSGTVFLQETLVTRGTTPDDFLRGLTGVARFEIKDGTIRKMETLGKILSVLNLKRLFSGTLPDMSREGMPFDTISGNLRFKNGVMTTDDLKLDGPVVDVAVKGSVSLPDREIAMVATAMGMDFDVQGPAEDPTVSSRAMKGITEGIGSLLEKGLGLFR